MTYSHRPELDGVRGIAIGLVVAAHALYPTTLFPGGGVIGVQLFFVLSGFLITGILARDLQDGRVRLARFYMRRARRLVPALALFLVVYAAWAAATGHDRGPQILLAATYVSNWAKVGGATLSELDHTWSLAVEEQFYLVWPLLLTLAVATRRPVLLIVGGAVALAGVRAMGGEWGRVYYATDLVAPALLAGAALALAPSVTLARPRLVAGLGFAVLLALSLTMTAHSETGRTLLVTAGFPVAILASAALIAGARQADIAWLRFRPLVFLGLISYGLYLWHTAINRIALADGWDVTARLVLVPVSIGVAYASWRWWEARFRLDLRAEVLDAPHQRERGIGPDHAVRAA